MIYFAFCVIHLFFSDLAKVYSASSDSEGSNNDSYDNYSDDFEGDSPAKTHTHSSSIATHASKHGSNKHSNKPAQPSKENTHSHSQGQGKTTTSKESSSHMQSQPQQQGRELSAEQVRAQEDVSSLLRDRERVMNPMKESLAHSLLASQVLYMLLNTTLIPSCLTQWN